MGLIVGKIVRIDYVDDFTGEPVDAHTVDTVAFSYRGNDYVLVLTADNGAQFDADMARYIKAAKKAQARDARASTKKPGPAPRKAAGKKTAVARKAAPKPTKALPAPARPAEIATKTAAPRKTKSSSEGSAGAGRDQSRAIREWALANGHTVSPRGRLSTAVIDAFHAAN